VRTKATVRTVRTKATRKKLKVKRILYPAGYNKMSIQVLFWVKLTEEKDSVSVVSKPIVFESEEALENSQIDHFDDILHELEQQTGAVITDPASQVEVYSITKN
jgi:hypothetical protein